MNPSVASSIRFIRPRELPLARAVLQLPLSGDEESDHRVYLAVDENGTRLFGAAVVCVVESHAMVWLEVLPSYRRQGIGTRLWASVEQVTRETETQMTWHGISDKAGFAFAGTLGFKPAREIVSFEFGIPSYLNYFQKWSARFEARGVVPAQLAEHYGADVDLVEVQALLGPIFGISIQERLSRMIAYGVTSRDWVYTLRVNDQLIGAVAGHFDGTCVCGDAYAIAPAFRGGWAQMVFKHKGIVATLSRKPELSTFRASAGTGFTDTIKWSQRIDATYLDPKWIYERKLVNK